MLTKLLKITLLALSILGYAYTVHAKLPADYQEFKARCQQECKTPEGTMKMYFDAVYSYIGGNTEEGSKMIRYIMHYQRGWERTSSTFGERINDPYWHYVFKSFAKGTSPENGYQMNPDNYSLNIRSVSKQNDAVLVNLISTGADNPRLFTLKLGDNGLYFLVSNAGSYAEVRKPKTEQYQDRSYDADYD